MNRASREASRDGLRGREALETEETGGGNGRKRGHGGREKAGVQFSRATKKRGATAPPSLGSVNTVDATTDRGEGAGSARKER